jgi:hypothetical protein
MAQEVKIKRSESSAGQRSLFWPIVLISIGVIWLLGNLGVISGANIAVLFRLWPLILIIVGVELLVGRNNPQLSALIGIGGVILIIVLMLVGPSLGWAGDTEVKTASFSEPLDDAASARVNLDLGISNTTISALADSPDLFSADLTYMGDVEFVAEGETDKIISLSETNEAGDLGFNFFGFGGNFDDQQLLWDVRLNPAVPIDLDIKGGVGEANLDLSTLNITALDISSGVGAVTLSLPTSGESYEVSISSGVGQFDVTIPEGPNVTLNIEGGVGQFTLDVPDNAGVTLNAKTGVGQIELPSNYECVEGCEGSDFLGRDGSWQTQNSENADQRITITFEGGVGGLTVR